MWTGDQNGYFVVNGRVRAPIVLRSETEILIAQNAHNLIWERHWEECEQLDREIGQLKHEGGNWQAAEAKLKAIFPVVQAEIDALVTAEIIAHREERAGFGGFADVSERLERLERKFKALDEAVDEVRSLAEEAQETAEEAQETAEEALEAADVAEEIKALSQQVEELAEKIDA